MDKELFWHVFWNNLPSASVMVACTSLLWNMFRGFKLDIKNDIAAFKAESDRKWEANERKWEANERKWESNERKWEAINSRLDNTYSLILEEIRSRKQEGK